MAKKKSSLVSELEQREEELEMLESEEVRKSLKSDSDFTAVKQTIKEVSDRIKYLKEK